MSFAESRARKAGLSLTTATLATFKTDKPAAVEASRAIGAREAVAFKQDAAVVVAPLPKPRREIEAEHSTGDRQRGSGDKLINLVC